MEFRKILGILASIIGIFSFLATIYSFTSFSFFIIDLVLFYFVFRELSIRYNDELIINDYKKYIKYAGILMVIVVILAIIFFQSISINSISNAFSLLIIGQNPAQYIVITNNQITILLEALALLARMILMVILSVAFISPAERLYKKTSDVVFNIISKVLYAFIASIILQNFILFINILYPNTISLSFSKILQIIPSINNYLWISSLILYMISFILI